MEISEVGMPGYRINEYRLVIPLPEVLQEKVNTLRTTLYEKYKVKFPFIVKPSLTILKCNAFEKTEPRLIEQLQHIALGTDLFKVELKDFSAYPSHSIFINVLTKSPFHELCKELKRCKRLMQVPEHNPHFINEPHLIVAQKLKPFPFINMWLECEHSEFSARFMADAFLLLKRSTINDRYVTVRRMEFMSLPMNVKQGSLFS